MGPTSVSTASAAAAVGKVRAKLGVMSRSTLSERQALSLKETKVSDAVWVSQTTFPAPQENDILQAIISVTKSLGNGDEVIEWPEPVPVNVEWTSQRSSHEIESSRSQLSEEEKYLKLMKSAPSRMTILYVHGGAY